MSFFDKAKQAATEMAAKADQAMANAGISGPPGGITGSLGGLAGGDPGVTRSLDAALRDFGLLSWREAHGHPVDASEKERVLTAMRELEALAQWRELSAELSERGARIEQLAQDVTRRRDDERTMA